MDAHLGQLQASVSGAAALPVWCMCPRRGAGGTRDTLGQACGHRTGCSAALEGASPTPCSFLSCCGAEGAGWEPPAWGVGKGLLPSPIPRLPRKAAPGRACCQHSYSWPSSAHSSALRESAVISSVIKGLGKCSTSLKKQENNNNDDLYSGMLPSGVRIALSAFRIRKLFMPQPRQRNGGRIPASPGSELSALPPPGSTHACSPQDSLCLVTGLHLGGDVEGGV